MINQDLLVKNYVGGAAVAPRRIVKFGTADDAVIQAAAATDAPIGVSDKSIGADAAGDRIDVIKAGMAVVEYGGTVTRGAWLTSDANGRAIATTTAGNECIGRAETSGVSGDWGVVNISLSRY